MKKHLKKLLVSALGFMLAVAFLVGAAVPASAAKYDPNTDWIAGKYGIFLHYLLERQGGGTSLENWNNAVNSFDVDRFAKDFEVPAKKMRDAGKLLMYHNHNFE